MGHSRDSSTVLSVWLVLAAVEFLSKKEDMGLGREAYACVPWHEVQIIAL